MTNSITMHSMAASDPKRRLVQCRTFVLILSVGIPFYTF
jgi:hypothetical protein